MIVKIGKTKNEVRLTHAGRSPVYFAENYLGVKLQPYQKRLMSLLVKKISKIQINKVRGLV